MADFDVTRELMEAVALAQLYRDDPITAMRKVWTGGKITNAEMQNLYRSVISHPDYAQVKADTLKIEEATLVDDNLDSVVLNINKLIREAKEEKKYEVVARLLKELREIKQIDNEQMKFEITITVKPPKGGESQ